MRAVLALDTSGPVTCVAVSRDGEIFEEENRDLASHAEDLSELVKGVLSKAGVAPAELAGLVVGSGPGSFTGLRIGLGFMKGMALALELPLRAVSSMHAMASGSCRTAQCVAVLGDARSGGLFAALYERADGAEALVTVLSPFLAPRAEAFERIECELRARPGRPQAWVSWDDGVFEVLTAGAADGGDNGRRGLSRRPERVASSLIALADAGSGEAPRTALALSRIEPEYLRPVAAKKISER